MNENLPTAPAPVAASPTTASHGVSPGRRTSRFAGLLHSLLWIAALGGGVAAWKFGLLAAPAAYKKPTTTPAAAQPVATLDGMVTVSNEQRRALGITVGVAEIQRTPVQLKLLGTTKYDEDVLSRVRLMFPARVDRVYIRTGQVVRVGDPLVDVYSTALSDAKSEYEINKIQWEYHERLAKTREELRRQGSIAEQLYLETRNEEMRRRRELDVSRDKLLIYGLTAAEIDEIESQTGTEKARMTIRSPASGIVAERNVVAGNLYDETDKLLIVTPVDHLWVWGNVFESDLDLIRLGQAWDIKFPFQRDVVRGTIEYISNHVDPLTRAVRVRTSIPNLDGRLKSDMLVEGALQIDPIPGRIIVPRSAMVVAGDSSYVFVQSPTQHDQFMRRTVHVAHETASFVLLDSGVEDGEQVVTTGALILSQLCDDSRVCATGLPKHVPFGFCAASEERSQVAAH